MKWLNSIGELLYEVMSWLVFYPITLWRTIRSPVTMMSYADDELHDRKDEQFTDTLNPPLFLVLSLVLAHLAENTFGGGTNPIVAKRTGLAALISDDTSLLVFRMILFSLFPLMMSARFLRARGVSLTRQRLKPPFYAQCYACAPFALFLGLGTSVGHTGFAGATIVGMALSIGAVLSYLAAETLWFSHHLGQSRLRALLNAMLAFVEATVVAIAIGALILLR